jgi:hypothetical protein
MRHLVLKMVGHLKLHLLLDLLRHLMIHKWIHVHLLGNLRILLNWHLWILLRHLL